MENSGSVFEKYGTEYQKVDVSGLMGHAPATVDDKGRIKIPNAFRQFIVAKYGAECFITSVDGEKASIYPLPVWEDFQSRLAKVPSTSVAKQKMLERVNYFGQLGSIDAQGRLLVPTVLRSVAGISGEVVVLGNQDHLVVWSDERMKKRILDTPMTAEDMKELELHGV